MSDDNMATFVRKFDELCKRFQRDEAQLKTEDRTKKQKWDKREGEWLCGVLPFFVCRCI